MSGIYTAALADDGISLDYLLVFALLLLRVVAAFALLLRIIWLWLLCCGRIGVLCAIQNDKYLFTQRTKKKKMQKKNKLTHKFL
jgi:hypothetical protein